MNSANGRGTPVDDQNWWGKRWLTLLNELGLVNPRVPLNQRAAGRRVRQLEVFPGRIEADLHSRSEGDCQVTVHVAPLSETEWEDVLDTLGSQALYSAQLLAGDMPHDIDQVFERAGTHLFPADRDHLTHDGSCCAGQDRNCPALLSVLTAVGELLNDDPWLLLRLRGRDRQQVLRSLRGRRNKLSSTSTEQADASNNTFVYRAPDRPEAEEHVAPLDDLVDHFWGRARDQQDFQPHIAPPLVELSLLRRLGPPQFADHTTDATELLAGIYRRVTAAGLALAFAPEPEDESDTGVDDTDHGLIAS